MIYILKYINEPKQLFFYFLFGIVIMIGCFLSSLNTTDILASTIKHLCLITCTIAISVCIISLTQTLSNYLRDRTDSIASALKDSILPVSIALFLYLMLKNLVLTYIPWASVSLTILSFLSLFLVCTIFCIILQGYSLVSAIEETLLSTLQNVIPSLAIFIILFSATSILFFTVALVSEFIADGMLSRISGLCLLLFFTAELAFWTLLTMIRKYLSISESNKEGNHYA